MVGGEEGRVGLEDEGKKERRKGAQRGRERSHTHRRMCLVSATYSPTFQSSRQPSVACVLRRLDKKLGSSRRLVDWERFTRESRRSSSAQERPACVGVALRRFRYDE